MSGTSAGAARAKLTRRGSAKSREHYPDALDDIGSRVDLWQLLHEDERSPEGHALTLALIDVFGPMTLEEVGRLYGLSRERIRQIEHRARQKLSRDPHLFEKWVSLQERRPTVWEEIELRAEAA